MDRNPDFSLPPRDGGRGGPDRRVISIVAAVVALTLALSVFFLTNGEKRSGATGAAGLSAKKLETLALKFEEQKLSGAAARTWADYLDVARPRGKDAAQVWFRIGKLYQDAGEYERALEAYYRSEAIAAVPDLEPEIAKRTAECLESLGNFAALNTELESRTAVSKSDTTGGGAVLAEVGTWKITKADLDQMLSAEIDAELTQVAGGMTPEERKAQKEKLLESVAQQGATDQWLQRFVVEELLYRRAREEKLNESPEYRALTRSLERKILAQQYLDREYAKRITIAPDDAKKFYDANKDQFKKDGKVQPFDLVKDQAYAMLRQQKEIEVQQQIYSELKERYNVVIHTAQVQGK